MTLRGTPDLPPDLFGSPNPLSDSVSPDVTTSLDQRHRRSGVLDFTPKTSSFVQETPFQRTKDPSWESDRGRVRGTRRTVWSRRVQKETVVRGPITEGFEVGLVRTSRSTVSGVGRAVGGTVQGLYGFAYTGFDSRRGDRVWTRRESPGVRFPSQVG